MKLLQHLRGSGTKARALRATGITVFASIANNVLRLGSNLVLARLLTPEIFGLIALANVFLTGLKMFSDTGSTTAIMRSPRGDDPDFLNTAWTLQVFRGGLIWLGACALALPVALSYGEPMLAVLLPAAAISMLISGFTPTKAVTAGRHLQLERVTALALSTQLFQALVVIAIAWVWPSPWAIVIGGILGALLLVLLQRVALPGPDNRFRWEREARQELFTFGKFLFLATGCNFLIDQSDKMILGTYITTAQLGIYSIGYMIGSLPQMLSSQVAGQVMMPLYRQNPPAASEANRRKMIRVRRIVVAGSLALAFFVAMIAEPFVSLLYDSRYTLAGPIAAFISLSLLPRIILLGYGTVFLAAGDSRAHFMVITTTAALQTGLTLAGVIWLGVPGAILAIFAANLLTAPLCIYFLQRHKGWDAAGDAVFFAVGLVLNGLLCWHYWDEIARLLP